MRFPSRNAYGYRLGNRFRSYYCIDSVGEFRPAGGFGQAPAHDAPSMPLLLFDGSAGTMCLAIVEQGQLRQASSERVGVLAADEDARVFQKSSQYKAFRDSHVRTESRNYAIVIMRGS